jgi:hypothetical protein
MDEQDPLVIALRARANRDAEDFRRESPDAAPAERWVENRFTASLPLAAHDAGVDPGPEPHQELFKLYTLELTRALGIPTPREKGEKDNTPKDLPTPGER